MQMSTLSHDSLLSGELMCAAEERGLMGRIITVDLNLQRLHQEAGRRPRSAATTGGGGGRQQGEERGN